MAKAFSVASWNVEHLKDRQETNPQRVAFLRQQRPDVIAIYEAEGKHLAWAKTNSDHGLLYFEVQRNGH
jgi:hypothetical protein